MLQGSLQRLLMQAKYKKQDVTIKGKKSCQQLTTFIRRAVFILAAAKSAHAIQANVTQEAVVIDAASQHAVALDAFLVQGALRVRLTGGDAATLEAPVAAASAFHVALTGNRHANAFRFCRSSETR